MRKKKVSESHEVEEHKVGRTIHPSQENPVEITEAPLREPVYKISTLEKKSTNDDRNAEETKEQDVKQPTEKKGTDIEEEKQTKSNSTAIISIIVAILAIGLFALYGIQQSDKVQIIATKWNRIAYAQELRTVREEGFDLPVGAIILSSEERVSGYNKVIQKLDQQSCRVIEDAIPVKEYSHTKKQVFEDGSTRSEDVFVDSHRTEQRTVCEDVFVENAEPEYRIHYHYEIEKWIDTPELNTEAQGTIASAEEYNRIHERQWPEFYGNDKQRISSRAEFLYVDLQIDGTSKRQSYEISENLFEYCIRHIGHTCVASWNLLGTLTDVECRDIKTR
jgi:hypothetical protein